MEARCVIDRLDDGDQSGQRLVQHGELRFRGHLPGRAAEGGGPERGRVRGVGFWCVDQQGVVRLWCMQRTLPSYFCHTEMWLLLPLVKAERSQWLHRSRRVIPASRAIRSSSAGQTYRKGAEKVSNSPSITQ